MLASDYDEGKLKFPLIWQPKIDGVRGMHLTGAGLLGRSGKQHKNRFTTELFSHRAFFGIDGEFAAQSETHPDLCRLTTSALNTIEGSPFVLWHAFDFLIERLVEEPYLERLLVLHGHVKLLKMRHPELGNRIRVVPWTMCNSIEELNALDAKALDAGYEGSIVRDPEGRYKQGRSTPREGGLLRIKRFVEEEALVVVIEEGVTNLNDATLSPHGYTERSTHQENMAPNGLVGSLQCKLLKDLMAGSKLVGRAGDIITVSAGCMDHAQRKHYFENQDEIIGKVIKFQFFPKGVLNKPRFPTFKCIRAESDL